MTREYKDRFATHCKQYIKCLKKLNKTDPEQARKVAIASLARAGILEIDYALLERIKTLIIDVEINLDEPLELEDE